MHFSNVALVCLLPLVAAGRLKRQSPSFCGTTSQGADFAWQVDDFDYHASYIFSTPAHQIAEGFVRFNVTNPAVPFTASCTASSVQLEDFFYGTQVYTCTHGPDAPVGAGVTSFTFSRPTGALTFNQTWTCPDPQYPITFFGYASANLSLACDDTTYQTPDWTPGEIYSSRTVACAPVSLPVKPYAMAAIA